MQRHLYEHFSVTSLLQDIYVTVIDKTDHRIPLSVIITGFIPLRQRHICDLIITYVVNELC